MRRQKIIVKFKEDGEKGRMHGVFKQCKRCWMTYNTKTRKKDCPHEVSFDIAVENHFDLYTEQPNPRL